MTFSLPWATRRSGWTILCGGQCLRDAFRADSKVSTFFNRLELLPAVALFLADRGHRERAAEIYALASRYPYVANSRWFADIAGKHIAAAAAALPPDVLAVARERGRARDLDATVKGLLAEFGTNRGGRTSNDRESEPT